MTTAEQRIAALSPEQRELLLRRLRERAPAAAAPAAAAPELPRIPEVADRTAPVPLTDVQEVFWLGRSGLFDLGGCGANVYIENEFPGMVWPFSEEINAAFRKVIDRQEILRTVVRPDGTQQVLSEVPPFEVEVEDLSDRTPEAIEEHLAAVREQLRYARRPVDRWPLFQIVLHQVQNGMIRLHARFDAMLIDGSGRNVLIQELATLLAFPEAQMPAVEVTFLDYARALADFKSTATWERSRAYWLERIPKLPPAPLLPLLRDIGPEMVPRIVKRETVLLDAAAWTALKLRAARAGLSPTGAITAAFAEALRPWSEGASFTLGFGGSYRPPIHDQMERMIGTFTTLHLLAVEDEGATFLDRARRLQGRLTADLDHQEFSGLRVLRERNRLHKTGVRATLPIQFNSVVEHGDTVGPASPPADESELLAAVSEITEVEETPEEAPAEPPPPQRVPFTLQVTDKDLLISLPQVLFLAVAIRNADGALELITQVVEEVFPAGLVPALLDVYRGVLERLAAGEEAWGEERPARRSLPAAVAPDPAPAPTQTLGSLFAAAAAQSPAAPALIVPGAGGETLTYAELDRRAASLAGRLHGLALPPGAAVAVVLETGRPETVTAAVAIALAGAAWVPLDPSLPPDVLHRRLTAANARAVLTRAALDAMPVWPEGLPRLAVDRPEAGDRREGVPASRTASGPAAFFFPETPEDTATAVPMDAAVAAAAVVDLGRYGEIGPGDRLLALSPAGSDLALFDLFGTFAAGATVVLPPPGAERDFFRLATLSTNEKVSVWSAPASLLDAVVEAAERNRKATLDALRLVLFQRESVPASLLGRLTAIRPDVRFAAAWGSPMVPVAAVVGALATEGASALTLAARPVAGRSVHVLDPAGDPRPDGVPGELWIGEPGGRLIATGERACRQADGALTLLGSGDGQVAALGYQVDLRRVEGALRRHPGLRHAAVAWQAGGDEGGGAGRLIAWILPRLGQPYDDDALRAYLRNELPAHLVPDVFIRLVRFPLTPDGRLDRAALEAPAETPPAPLDGDPLASALADLWRDVLGERPASMRDDFFAAGGDSLKAVRLLARVRERWGADNVSNLAAGELLARPTLGGMTAALRRATTRPGRLARFAAWLRGDKRYVTAAAGADREADAADTARRSANYGLRMYLILYVGNFISGIGTGFGQFALMVWILRQSQNRTSPFSVMMTLASVTALLMMPIGGSLADRMDRKKIMILGNVASMVMTLLMASALYTHTMRIWHSYVIAVVMNAIGNLAGPASMAVVPQLVSRRQLVRMAGLSSTVGALTGMAVPFLAGFLVQKIDYHGVIFFDSFTFLFAIATIAIVRIPRPPATSRPAQPSILGDFLFGWRYMRERRGLLHLLSMFGLTNLSAGIVTVLLGPLILSFASPVELGKVDAAAAAGMIIGSFVLSLWGGPQRRVWGIFFGLIVQACLLFLGGLQPNVALVSFALCIAMFTAPIVNGCNQAIWQSKVALDAQGRVMAARGTFGMLVMPLAYLIAGPLADKVFGPALLPGGRLAGSIGSLIGVGAGRGVGLLFIVLGLFMIAVVLLAFLNPTLRNVEDELPNTERPNFGGAGGPRAEAA